MVIKNGTFGNDLLVGTNNADSLNGSFGNDLLRGLGGNDTLSGGGDNDTLEGGAGNDGLFGDGGVDTMVFDTASNVLVSAAFGLASSAGLGTDHFDSVENLTTGSGNDQIYFDGQANVINTGGGADIVYAYGGADIVDGGAQADQLHGGDGNDALSGSGGNDALYGDAGDDTLLGGSGNDGMRGGAGVDLIEGGDGNDTLYATGDGDALDGDGGIDTIVYDTALDVSFDHEFNEASVNGNDPGTYDYIDGIENVITGSGDDYIKFNAIDGDGNVIQAGAGEDRVYSYSGDDTIDGGSGDDELSPGTGLDLVTGGLGADIFRFLGDASEENDSGVGVGNRDRILDFDQAEGDGIALRFYDEDLGGDVDLDFIGQNAFSAPNQVRWFQSGGVTVVGINTVGNSTAEMQIELTGTINLVEGDFIL